MLTINRTTQREQAREKETKQKTTPASKMKILKAIKRQPALTMIPKTKYKRIKQQQQMRTETAKYDAENHLTRKPHCVCAFAFTNENYT